eukprot:CAMPEP_0184298356 /NCGR_PEP_ID=MMETSP1049-20130417/9190_1 /TAXON_ID=77928 /ORGANISM="Proteomonas sulcata, Strain CCMP704" /LENGTH=74 /DNA_ID=CAMNT_0026608473 /DNA_START=183 /DNA_END=407 /DNA_ORIENTATION=-
MFEAAIGRSVQLFFPPAHHHHVPPDGVEWVCAKGAEDVNRQRQAKSGSNRNSSMCLIALTDAQDGHDVDLAEVI